MSPSATLPEQVKTFKAAAGKREKSPGVAEWEHSQVLVTPATPASFTACLSATPRRNPGIPGRKGPKQLWVHTFRHPGVKINLTGQRLFIQIFQMLQNLKSFNIYSKIFFFSKVFNNFTHLTLFYCEPLEFLPTCPTLGFCHSRPFKIQFQPTFFAIRVCILHPDIWNDIFAFLYVHCLVIKVPKTARKIICTCPILFYKKKNESRGTSYKVTQT